MALGELRSTWEDLGRTDPLWAVLSDPARRYGGWDVDEFMATGHGHIARVVELLERSGHSLGRRVLDFGCGVGRLSNALAERVPEVVGIDIAASMIERAEQLNRHPDRIRFVHYDGRSLPFEDNTFDSAVSLIVLQHARPVVQLASLLELIRVVRPDGVIVVQIPSHPRQVRLDPAAYRARIDVLSAPQTLPPGGTAMLRARVTNTSEHAWPRSSGFKLGNHWWDGERMLVQDDGRTQLPTDLAPGESIELELAIRAPMAPGRFDLELDLVQEFVTWWAAVGSPTARTTVVVGAEAAAPAAETTPQPAPAATAEDGPEPGADAAAEAPDASAAEQPDGNDGIEMHGLHVDFLHAFFAHTGCRIIDAVADELAGQEWESYTYIVQPPQ